MSRDKILPGGPISEIVSAAILPRRLAGREIVPAGRFRTTLPIGVFAGKLLNAF